MGEEAFFQYRERTESHARRWNVASSGATGNDGAGPDAPPSAATDPHHTSNRVLTVGGILLGVGALALLIGGIAVAAGGDAGVFVITVGALLGIGGLITLIVGAIIRATEG
jgi:ferric-dicitrate binding protein FerR (iron transport regulator)